MVKNNTEDLDPKVELEQQETVEVQDAVVEELLPQLKKLLLQLKNQ